jgi:hypothetical protein
MNQLRQSGLQQRHIQWSRSSIDCRTTVLLSRMNAIIKVGIIAL